MSCRKKINENYQFIRAEKALGETVDYSIDYAKVLALVSPTDTILTSNWTITSNAVLGAMSINGTIATVWVSGGTKIGSIVRLTNTIVSAGGRTHVRVIILKIINRLAVIPNWDPLIVP